MGTAKRIAINVGGDYVGGTNAIVTGVVLAANGLGWEVVGIRDGFDGLLFPDRYPDGGIEPIRADAVRDASVADHDILGNATRANPFRLQVINDDNEVEEVDRSDELIAAVRRCGIDAVVSIVDHNALSLPFRLSGMGLTSICVPKSVENDVPDTTLSFGFNTALNYTVEILDRARQAARSAGKLGVVEILGTRAGWLALQAAIAVNADAVLIPEVPYDLKFVATALQERGRRHGLVVVAEGAMPIEDRQADETAESTPSPLRASLSPLATGADSTHVIDRSGAAAEAVAVQLQRLTELPTYPLVPGPLVRAGLPTATDRQLGLGYGASAVRALSEAVDGALVVFQPPSLKYVPLREAVNKFRRVPADSVLVQTARALGISLGDEVTS